VAKFKHIKFELRFFFTPKVLKLDSKINSPAVGKSGRHNLPLCRVTYFFFSVISLAVVGFGWTDFLPGQCVHFGVIVSLINKVVVYREVCGKLYYFVSPELSLLYVRKYHELLYLFFSTHFFVELLKSFSVVNVASAT